MKHPKGVILDELVGAGVPLAVIHDVANRITAAYDEANPTLVDHLDRRRPRIRFDLEEAHGAPGRGETP